MLKNGFLQQNAFDDTDKYCSIEKQIAILELIMTYHNKALECIKNGAAFAEVSKLKVCEEIVRIKMVYKNDEMDKIAEIKNHLETQLNEAAREHRQRE